jgi:flagellar biogenesis protein FliO
MGAILMLIKVGFVFGLLFVTLRVVGKLYAPGARGGSRKPGQVVEVLGRQSIGRNADVTVVSFGDRTLVLGVTEHSVNVVTELEPEEIVETISLSGPLPAAIPARTQASPSVPSWRDLIDNLRERTVRR